MARSAKSGGRNKRKPSKKIWRDRFLGALAATKSVQKACKAAGISSSRVYEVRDEDEEFAKAWEHARWHIRDQLAATLIEQACHGVEEYVISNGRVVHYMGRPLVRRRYNAALQKWVSAQLLGWRDHGPEPIEGEESSAAEDYATKVMQALQEAKTLSALPEAVEVEAETVEQDGTSE